jgi:hypothetical protein
MRRACLLSLVPAAIFAQQASFEGTAIDKQSQQPLSGVHVSLITGVSGGPTGAYGAMTDRTGHFSIATIRPGMYLMICDRPGYLHVVNKESGIPNVSLKPGQQLKDFKIEMTPRAVLSGRVLDENGDPMQGVSVETVALPPENLSIMQSAFGQMDRLRGTDDRGEFRIIVVPGKYNLKATIPGNQSDYSASLPERRNDGSILPPYAATFYPGTAVKGRATTVDAIAGRETSGLEIRMTRQQGISITGIVSGVPEGMQRPNVQLVTLREGTNMPVNSRGTSVGPDGKFTFTGIEPATYRVYATYYKDSKVTLASRTVELRAEGSDPAPVSLMLQPTADVNGSLIIEGAAPGSPATKRTVRLDPVGMWINNASGQTDRDNNFQASGLMPGKYKVKVEALPENAYVKAIEMDGNVIADDNIEIGDTARSVPLKITVSLNGAQISGRVLDAEGNKLLTPIAMIALIKGPNPEDLTQAEVTPDSRYSFKALRPGKYRIIGINPFDQAIDTNGDARTMLAKLSARGEEIEINEGDRIAKDVKLLSKEALNAK